MSVTIGNLSPEAGTSRIAYADKHSATFLIWTHEDDEASYSVLEGTLRFDDGPPWLPGTNLAGALRVVGDGSDVGGTFVARICPEE